MANFSNHPKKQFCPKGHDTFVYGRDKNDDMCKICKNTKSKEYHYNHKEEAKEKYRQNSERFLIKSRKYYASHRDTILEQKKEYEEMHKDEIKMSKKDYYIKVKDTAEYKLVKRISRLKMKFGLTMEDFNNLLIKQNGKCAICKSDEPGGRGTFHIDHDHRCCSAERSCGKCIRGLLCTKCNIALALFMDSKEILKYAIDYLTKYE